MLSAEHIPKIAHCISELIYTKICVTKFVFSSRENLIILRDTIY